MTDPATTATVTAMRVVGALAGEMLALYYENHTLEKEFWHRFRAVNWEWLANNEDPWVDCGGRPVSPSNIEKLLETNTDLRQSMPAPWHNIFGDMLHRHANFVLNNAMCLRVASWSPVEDATLLRAVVRRTLPKPMQVLYSVVLPRTPIDLGEINAAAQHCPWLMPAGPSCALGRRQAFAIRECADRNYTGTIEQARSAVADAVHAVTIAESNVIDTVRRVHELVLETPVECQNQLWQVIITNMFDLWGDVEFEDNGLPDPITAEVCPDREISGKLVELIQKTWRECFIELQDAADKLDRPLHNCAACMLGDIKEATINLVLTRNRITLTHVHRLQRLADVCAGAFRMSILIGDLEYMCSLYLPEPFQEGNLKINNTSYPYAALARILEKTGVISRD